MQISIIIPIYKVEQYIERCIKSVITQTFTDYEVILVGDKSPDNALQIAEELLKENSIEFQAVKHKENKGLAAVRNSGIKIAKGKYLLFMDSDDLANTEVLQWFYNAVQQDDYGFVTGRVNCYKEGIRLQYQNYYPKRKGLYRTEIIQVLMQGYIKNEAWNKLIKKEFIEKTSAFLLRVTSGKIYHGLLMFAEMPKRHVYCLNILITIIDKSISMQLFIK